MIAKYKLLLQAGGLVALVLLGFGVGWSWQGDRWESKYSERETEYTEARAEAELQARSEELMPLMLIALLSGCANKLPSYPVAPPAVPPLTMEARQSQTKTNCGSESCSNRWNRKGDEWLELLTKP